MFALFISARLRPGVMIEVSVSGDADLHQPLYYTLCSKQEVWTLTLQPVC